MRSTFPRLAIFALVASLCTQALAADGISLRSTTGITNPKPAASSVGGWTCPPGLTPRGSECVGVTVPPNATLDLSGRVWTCNRGYRRSGNSCVAFLVPENAELDLMGTGWVCKAGFVRQNTHCVPR